MFNFVCFVFSLSLYLMYVYIMFDDEELIVFKSYYEIKFCSVLFCSVVCLRNIQGNRRNVFFYKQCTIIL